jgi:hypothetical protein
MPKSIGIKATEDVGDGGLIAIVVGTKLAQIVFSRGELCKIGGVGCLSATITS